MDVDEFLEGGFEEDEEDMSDDGDGLSDDLDDIDDDEGEGEDDDDEEDEDEGDDGTGGGDDDDEEEVEEDASDPVVKDNKRLKGEVARHKWVPACFGAAAGTGRGRGRGAYNGSMDRCRSGLWKDRNGGSCSLWTARAT